MPLYGRIRRAIDVRLPVCPSDRPSVRLVYGWILDSPMF